jgi:hypothetical protein
MFHVIGSTPEAATVDAGLRVEPVSLADLRAARDALVSPGDAPLAAVSLGTPHASLDELERYVTLLAGRRVDAGVEVLISTGRDTLARAEDAGVAERLRSAGAELLTDTCSYIAPILRPTNGTVMTDSGKWAWYAPGNIGASVAFGSTRECVESAVAGRVLHDDAVWGRP